MAATFNESQKIDYLWKKIGYGVTKTAESTVKEAVNESIPSPLLYRGDLVWMQSGDIPSSPPSSTSSIIRVYKDGGGAGYSATVECTEDLTSPDNQTWKTNLTGWIPTQFGDNYLVLVYVANSGVNNPQTVGTKLFAAGSGSDDTWFFDYQAGVLNFNGSTIPTQIASPITGKSIYIVGYRYIGLQGVTNIPSNTNIGNLNLTGTTISSIDTNGNIILTPNGTGIIQISSALTANGNITAPFFIGNGSQLTGVSASNALSAGTVTTNAQPNITSVGTLTSLTVAGNITTGGILTDNYYYANGSPLDFQQPSGSNTQIQFNDNQNFGASANFTFNSSTNVLTVTGNIAGSNVNAGNLLTANYISGTLTTAAQPNITSTGTLGSLNVTGNANVGNIGATAGVFTSVTGTLTTNAQSNVTSVGTLISLAVTGNASAGNILTDNLLYANGSPWDMQLPQGSNTSVQFNDDSSFGGSANFTFNKSTNVLTVTGNISGSNVNAGNLLTANYVAGTLTTNAQPNITSTGTLVSLDVTGNITSGNANLGNLVTANFFTGNGYLLTGVGNATAIVNGNSNVSIPTANGNVNISAAGNNIMTITGTGANIAGTANVTGNLSAGNIGATAGVFTSVTGTLTTNAQPNITSTGTLVSLDVTGNLSAGNLTINGSGSFDGNVNMNTHSITNLANPVNDQDAATKYYVDSTAQGLDPKASVNVSTTVPLGTYSYNNGTSGVGATITGSSIGVLTIDTIAVKLNNRVLVKNEPSAGAFNAYNGIYLCTTEGTASAAYVLTRSTDFNQASEMYSAYTFTEEGYVNADTGWVCTNNSSTPIIIGTTPIVFTQFSGAGTYTAGAGLTLTGTEFSVNTAQPGITSVGTLTSLNVTGNANVGNIGATSGIFTNVTGTLTTNAQPNVTSVGTLTSLNVTGNANVGNIGATAGVFTSVTGTLTTNAQPNITSTGTLVSLTVTGNVAAGNILTDNLLYANGSPWDMQQPQGSNTSVQFNDDSSFGGSANFTFNKSTNVLTVTGNIAGSNVNAGNLLTANYVAGTLTTNAQPNITSTGTLTSLTVSGVSNVGPVGNLTVTGGTSGQYLQTNGSGVLSWGTVGTSGIANGTSNISIPVINGNVNTSVGGNANVLVVTDTGINVVGTVITGNGGGGNITGANLVSANYFTGTLTTNAQPNITSVGTLTSLDISGKLTANTFQMGYGIYEFYTAYVFYATTVSTAAGQVLWSKPAAGLSAVDFTIIGTDTAGATRQTLKISAAILGTAVAYNEYGGLYINGGVGSFSVGYNPNPGGPAPTFDLIVTPDSSNLTEYRMMISEYAV